MDSNNTNSGSNPKIYSPSRSIPQHSGHGIMSPASNSSANNHNNNGTNDSSADGIQKLLAERMATGGGALCNDPNGLCLGYEGSIDASKSGIYTSIAKLAGMLSSSSSSSTSNSNNSSSNNNAKKGNNEVPLVSIQTERASLLVKEYGGRTIVFRVPNADEEMDNSNRGGGGAEGGGNGEGDLMMSSNNAAAATNSTGDVGGDS